jgi:hypothetical protein
LNNRIHVTVLQPSKAFVTIKTSLCLFHMKDGFSIYVAACTKGLDA